jgi:hypothetical protein
MEAISALVPSLPAAPDAPATTAAPSPVMEMLHDHVPLTLLLDLALGVRSSEVYEDEIADLSWVPVVVSRAG